MISDKILSSNELIIFEKESKEFISKNKAKFHAYKELDQYMANLTPETFQDMVQFIQSNHDAFFKDHASAIYFFLSYMKSMWPYFKKLEILLDVIIYFKDEFKRLDVSEEEILSICSPNDVFFNYLFKKNFITIECIVEKSINTKYLFVNFLPEIREYDPEYAELHEKTLFDSLEGNQLDFLLEFKELVDSDPEKHIKNRESCYNPSVLHKSIRDDDIDMFQSILSKNGIDCNYNFKPCVYERSQNSPIQSYSLLYAATIYNSKKIVKFLLLQPGIELDSELIIGACIAKNIEFIHYYEQIGPFPSDAIYFAIIYNQNDILTYFLENNMNDSNETDPLIKKSLTNKYSNYDENIYYKLNSTELDYLISSTNFHVLKRCLPKILYLFKKVELTRDQSFFNYTNFSYLSSSCLHVELFKFIYFLRDRSIPAYNLGACIYSFLSSIKNNHNDAFFFMFENFGYKFELHSILMLCVRTNIKLANYFLDEQLKEIENNVQNKKNSFFYKICKKIQFSDFIKAVDYYCEDVLVKMVNLYEFVFIDDNLREFLLLLSQKLSSRMFKKFLVRINLDISSLVDALRALNLNELSDYVLKNSQ